MSKIHLKAAVRLLSEVAELEKELKHKQRPWVGLTMDDINQFETWFDDEEERKGWVDPALIAKYFEAKLREKNS